MATPSTEPLASRDEPARLSWYAAYTRVGGEARTAEQLQDLAVEEVLLPRLPASSDGTAGELLFPSYVFLRAEMTRELASQLGRLAELRYLVGTRPGVPSPIPEEEMRVVRYVAGLDRDIRLGPVPERGRRARVVQGPLQGAEGIVTWRNKREARLASTISVVGRAVELVVPLEWIVLAEYETGGEPYKKKHRGGRRGRSGRIAGNSQPVAESEGTGEEQTGQVA